ncbi:uncharacterized protein METZ01_LOCUS262259, partial [marine metagenome]
MVGATGFEPATSTSRTWRATGCATPRHCHIINAYWVAANIRISL